MEKNQSKLTVCDNCLKMTATLTLAGIKYCVECTKEKSGCVSMSQARRTKIQKESKKKGT